VLFDDREVVRFKSEGENYHKSAQSAQQQNQQAKTKLQEESVVMMIPCVTNTNVALSS
jgi:hypothetical protein